MLVKFAAKVGGGASNAGASLPIEVKPCVQGVVKEALAGLIGSAAGETRARARDRDGPCIITGARDRIRDRDRDRARTRARARIGIPTHSSSRILPPNTLPPHLSFILPLSLPHIS